MIATLVFIVAVGLILHYLCAQLFKSFMIEVIGYWNKPLAIVVSIPPFGLVLGLITWLIALVILPFYLYHKFIRK